MKRVFTFLMIAVCTTLLAQPKDHEERKKKMDAMRIAFITESVDLTPEEAQVFWPIYNEKNGKVDKLRMEVMHKMMKMRKEGKTIDDLSDKELTGLMDKKIQNEKDIAMINGQYHSRFIEAIGIKKTAKLYKAEMDFQRELLHHFKNKGKHHGEGKRERN